MSSALEVLRCSIRRLGMLNGCTCMLSELNWCLRGRCRSGLGRDKLSSFSLLRWFLQNTTSHRVNSFTSGTSYVGSCDGTDNIPAPKWGHQSTGSRYRPVSRNITQETNDASIFVNSFSAKRKWIFMQFDTTRERDVITKRSEQFVKTTKRKTEGKEL
jgi:hypothetical protein